MTLTSAVAVGVVAGLFGMLLREVGGKYAVAVTLTGGVLLLGYFATRLSPSLALLRSLLSEGPMAPYAEPVLKAIGIGYLVEIGGSVCRDMGAESVAAKLELCGKAELLAIGLPLFTRLLSLALSLIGG